MCDSQRTHPLRIAGLEPIAATVRAFDVVRNPLEDWSTQRREFFENVPPLEMTVELLREQLAEASQIRDEAAEHKEAAEKLEELSERFLRDTEVFLTVQEVGGGAVNGPV